MEDPLKPLDLKGYSSSVTVLPYREVVRIGDLSSKSGVFPKPEDTAIIMYTSGSTGMLILSLVNFSSLFTLASCRLP